MRLQIEVISKEEALEAIAVLSAYSGSTVAAQAVETKEEVKASEPKKQTAKKTPAKKQPVKKVEDSEEESEATDGSGSNIGLKQLTQIAKEAVERTDRAEAKKVISKYGTKLSEVDESDYDALAKELEELGA